MPPKSLLSIGLFKIDYYVVITMINYGDPEASIIKAFRNRGYKATPQRIAISRYILSNHEHPTAQKAHLEVKKTHPTVSLATVYSTIRILKDMGLVMELNLSQGETRYDPNTEAHAHLLCIRCGCLIDWSDPIMGELISKVSAEANFTVIGSSLDLKGICDGCGQKEGSPPPRAAAND
ncbi:Transcriptional regulator, Fur family [Methanothrix harundinacea 6Ac]|uniref:Transcriptional regulator, Fur family n=2 Tax=Methanothrix harundinacea TaxID=301375 RepID=G7WL42_METH6|nr:Transcriptional regulator, Fur family [Methanothrix harundinacea 6Ac]